MGAAGISTGISGGLKTTTVGGKAGGTGGLPPKMTKNQPGAAICMLPLARFTGNLFIKATDFQ
jgi:hypothetical protein